MRHQMHRSNPATSSPEERYRVTLYNEFLSHVIRELLERFIEDSSHGSGLLYLLPSESIYVEVEDEIPRELAQAVDFYQDDLPHSVMFPTEHRMWIRKWKQHNLSTDTPKKLVDVNIFSFLKLALTLPITSCESERSFSQLKLMKTCIQSTMTDLRLNRLALMKIHRDRCNKIQKYPNKMKELGQSFRQLHPRRMKLPYVLAD